MWLCKKEYDILAAVTVSARVCEVYMYACPRDGTHYFFSAPHFLLALIGWRPLLEYTHTHALAYVHGRAQIMSFGTRAYVRKHLLDVIVLQSVSRKSHKNHQWSNTTASPQSRALTNANASNGFTVVLFEWKPWFVVIFFTFLSIRSTNASVALSMLPTLHLILKLHRRVRVDIYVRRPSSEQNIIIWWARYSWFIMKGGK